MLGVLKIDDYHLKFPPFNFRLQAERGLRYLIRNVKGKSSQHFKRKYPSQNLNLKFVERFRASTITTKI